MRWLMLKEGLRRVAAPNCLGSLARGDGESYLGGGRCSRRTCGGGGSLGPGPPAREDGEFSLGGDRCSRGACGG